MPATQTASAKASARPAAQTRKLFYRIQDVSEITGLKPYVLRYWETQFKDLAPQKDKSEQRRYRQKDIETIQKIKDLLYHQSYSHRRGLDYAGEAALTDPLISPVFADFHDLPPLLLQAGSVDPTSAHATIVHRNALRAGVEVELDIAPEMVHGFHGFANLGIPESMAALARARIFLDSRLGSDHSHA